MLANPRVLIVEDEMIVQLHLQEIVRELGYSISGVAATAAEALSSAAENPPDLTLMDIRLSGDQDGIDTARELMKRYGLGVVFVTAHADDETVQRTLDVGALGYVVKPFSRAQIRAALSTALTKHRADMIRSETTDDEPRQRAQPERFGAGTRMVIYSHDTLGLGHLKRCLHISRGLVSRFPGLSILLVTGSPMAHRFALPQGVDYIKLPAVRKVGAGEYQARSLGVPDEGVLTLRTNLLLRAVQDYDPDVVLVDHAPIGMKGEMLPTLTWLQQRRPSCIRMMGLRDIVDDPDSVILSWQKQGTWQHLQNLYDHILVYGSQEVFDPVQAYRFPAELAARTHFCNYIAEHSTEAADAPTDAPVTANKPLVVVTIGGGDGAGEAVIGSYLEMLRRFAPQITFQSLILTGPLVPPELMSRFQELASGLRVVLQEFTPSTAPYVRRSQLVISTGGYNTVTQTLRLGKRGLLIPRVMYRQEQLIRAQRLADMGLVTMLHPDDITPQRMFETVSSLLADPTEPLVEARVRRVIRLDGCDRVADLCATLFPANSRK